MDLQVQGKLALITGSTQGIGKEVAASLAREGAQVIVNGRSWQRVADTVQELEVFGSVRGIAADLATAEGVQSLVQQAASIGNIDILVNNLGKFAVKAFADITDDEWFDYFNFNVMSGIRLTRSLLPGMIQRNQGRIVFVSAQVAIEPSPAMLHYSLTKTAQLSLARGIAEMTRGTQVTVNSIITGPTSTEGAEGFLSQQAGKKADLQSLKAGYFHGPGLPSLLQRWACVEEVANLIVFLCSQRASYINGSAQRVEGGLVRAIL